MAEKSGKTAGSLAELSCLTLKGVGAKLAERLVRCGINSVQDLLFYLPSRYQDRTRISPIRSVRLGDHAVIEGIIESANMQPGRKPILHCRLVDDSGSIS